MRGGITLYRLAAFHCNQRTFTGVTLLIHRSDDADAVADQDLPSCNCDSAGCAVRHCGILQLVRSGEAVIGCITNHEAR
jgi:hypothetical protein